jgi:hypothetical protein
MDDFGTFTQTNRLRRGPNSNQATRRRPQTAPVTYKFTVLVDDPEEEKTTPFLMVDEEEESKELVSQPPVTSR